MKLQHIRESLDAIKEDDLIILEELRSKIENLEGSLNKKYTELDKVECGKEIINYALSIRDDKKKLLRFLSPILEFLVLIVGSLITVLIIQASTGILVLFLCALFGLVFDAINVIQKEYSRVSNKDKGLMGRLLEVFNNIFAKSERLAIQMDGYFEQEQLLNGEIKELQEKMSHHRNDCDKLSDEVCYIDGNIYAVDCLIDKYKMEDMNNELPLVKFIEEKKELKKTIKGIPY